MGMTLAQLAAEKQNEYKDEIILANVNGKLKELGEEYIPDSDVTFVTTSTSIGNETYRRSVVLLMLAAIEKIDRNIDRVVVEYSLSKGLYCTFDGDFRPDKEFIDEVKSVMHSMVEKDLPIKKELMKISDAMNLFKEKGMTDKTSLFKYRRSSFVNVYDLNGYKDYFYGYMASSTGMLGVFDIFLYDEGIVLQLPVKNAPLEVPEFNPHIIDREEPKTIKFETENSPVPFNFWIQLLPTGEFSCKMKLTIKAELNMFIKGMVKKPLQEGIEKIADALAMIPYQD